MTSVKHTKVMWSYDASFAKVKLDFIEIIFTLHHVTLVILQLTPVMKKAKLIIPSFSSLLDKQNKPISVYQYLMGYGARNGEVLVKKVVVTDYCASLEKGLVHAFLLNIQDDCRKIYLDRSEVQDQTFCDVTKMSPHEIRLRWVLSH